MSSENTSQLAGKKVLEGLEESEKEDIIQALKGRAAFYDMLAYLYFKPLTEEQVEHYAQMDWAAYEGINEYFNDGINDIQRYLRKRNTGTRQALAVDFTASFAGTSTWKGKSAVPYESVFTSEDGLLCQESYHEVYRLFKKHHVARREGLDFPDDHLSFMSEFLVILSERTIECLEAGDAQGALDNLIVSRDFLNDHILSWFDEFSELALCLLETRFYRGVLKISKGFFTFDREILDDLIETIDYYK